MTIGIAKNQKISNGCELISNCIFMTNRIKNIIIGVLSVLVLLLGGTAYFLYFGEFDPTTGEIEREKNSARQTEIISTLNKIPKKTEDDFNNIDSHIKPINYYTDKSKKEADEKISNYYNANDSIQFTDWARHAIYFKRSKLYK